MDVINELPENHDLDYPRDWSVEVFVAIYDEIGRVLISERLDGKGWNLPGGKAESGKLRVNELRREVLEETGLQIIGEPMLSDRRNLVMRPSSIDT